MPAFDPDYLIRKLLYPDRYICISSRVARIFCRSERCLAFPCSVKRMDGEELERERRTGVCHEIPCKNKNKNKIGIVCGNSATKSQVQANVSCVGIT